MQGRFDSSNALLHYCKVCTTQLWHGVVLATKTVMHLQAATSRSAWACKQYKNCLYEQSAKRGLHLTPLQHCNKLNLCMYCMLLTLTDSMTPNCSPCFTSDPTSGNSTYTISPSSACVHHAHISIAKSCCGHKMDTTSLCIRITYLRKV